MMQQSQPISMAARGLRPVAELAAGRPHGDRLRYMAGCRCQECRGANTAYEKQRAQARKAGEWNGLVCADKARAHMAALSGRGIGRRTVGDVSGVSDAVLSAVISGRKRKIRAATEKAILAVTEAAAADHALLPAGPTWQLLDELIAWGYAKAFLARELGNQRPALQISRSQVTVRNAYEVERLHERLRMCQAAPTQRLIDELREEGFRLAVIERHVAALADELGQPVPDLRVRKGFIQERAARLVERVHAKLME